MGFELFVRWVVVALKRQFIDGQVRMDKAGLADG